MKISGSLSFKYGAIGGSKKGFFIDSDKFKESDLNFFVTVKVINQSINSFVHETWNLKANIMLLPRDRIHFEHGFVDASDNPNGRSPGENAVVQVTFSRPFKSPRQGLVLVHRNIPSRAA
ncbi:hypothetical protein AAL_00308 [Moelleriella libera RCEF 2490]|uniref:Uncharacterized protein n=1 Tax=Moelleriella libera RCEF 2490 TaxID=1081109 RepID=A0A166UQR7_9HYPO|nr:hypothetical protein AAL_00308 [Moelleriella libera RCEF 2490]